MNDTTINIKSLSADHFVERYTKLVKRIAFHLAGRLPSHILVDDMIQAGMVGLLEARDNFDAGKGASFETFASIRIRGAMLDELRRGDWAPRSVHRAARDIAEAVRQVEHRTGRDAKDQEIAEQLGIPLADYHKMLHDAANVYVNGYEDGGISEDNMDKGLFSKLWVPDESFANSRFRQALAEQIAGLPERERLVISLYYQEELTLKEIGEVLSVTESRVCQIHSQAVLRLRSRLEDWE
jgi:RNA polymerase sigma factor for flagellar operon FliA